MIAANQPDPPPPADLAIGAFSEHPPWLVVPEEMVWRRGLDALRARVRGEAPRLATPRGVPPITRFLRVTSSVVGYLPDDYGWAKDPAEGGAWLDMGVHLFDALRWFTGSEADTVFADIRDFADAGLRRSGMAQVRLRNGVIAQVWISFEMPAPGLGSQSQWTFVGSDGIIESDSYGKVRLGVGDGWDDVFEMPPFGLNSDTIGPVRLKAFARQTEDFAQAVRDGRPPEVGPENGRAAVELVEATARSSETGQAVHLPLSAVPA